MINKPKYLYRKLCHRHLIVFEQGHFNEGANWAWVWAGNSLHSFRPAFITIIGKLMHIQYQRTYIFKQLYDTYRLFFHCQPLLARGRPTTPPSAPPTPPSAPPTHPPLPHPPPPPPPLYDIRAIQLSI